jgi:hypothetical protein
MPNDIEQAADTTHIDDVIAYLESPEYLRMAAHQQGEGFSAYRNALTPAQRDADTIPVLPAPEPVNYGLLAEWERDLLSDQPVSPPHSDDCTCPQHVVIPRHTSSSSQFGIVWDPGTNRCICQRCSLRRVPPANNTGPVYLRVRDPWQNFREVLSRRRPFTTRGALQGVSAPRADDSGRLVERFPSAHHLWRADFANMDYVVYSYATPIAWHVTGTGYSEWVYPNVRYSRSTSNHQNKILTALSNYPEGSEFVRVLEMTP